MALLEYFNGSTWIALSTLTNITLTGAVTGSGGSTISTVLNSTQTMSSSVLSFNWPTVIESDIYHYLPDSSPLSSSVPQFFTTIQAGSGSTTRLWSWGCQPGLASTSGATFSISFFHNTFSSRLFPFQINCNGTSFSTNLLGSLTIGGSLNLSSNQIVNLANPVLSNDAVNKNYADTSTIVPSRITGYPTNSSLFLNGLGSWSLVDINNSTTGSLAISRLAGYAAAPTTTFLKGDSTWSLVDINNNTTGSLLPSRISGYPTNSSLYLNGSGGWTAPSFSNVITTSAAIYDLTINNTNTSATATDLLIQENGVNSVAFGFNNSTNEAYVWAYNTASLKFGTASTMRAQILNNGTFDLLSNNLTTTGTINATTGTLKGNNLAAYNSGSIVVINPLAMSSNAITGLANPTNAQDAATKNYVDSSGGRYVLQGYTAATYSTNVAAGDHLKFDTVAFSVGSGITLDTSSTYSTSTNVASIGRITLAAGKTYKLTGSINNATSSGSGDYNATRWYNSDTNTALGLISGASPPNSTTNRAPGAGTIAYFTPAGTTRVELRITFNALVSVNGTADAIGPSWFLVETI